MTGKVVRLRRSGGEIVQDCDVYIGRRLFMGGWRLQPSEWANPFSVKECGTNEEACRRFEEYITTKRPDLMRRLPELRGKVLGCWCKPSACHGDVLLRLCEQHHADADADADAVHEETEAKEKENMKEIGAVLLGKANVVGGPALVKKNKSDKKPQKPKRSNKSKHK